MLQATSGKRQTRAFRDRGLDRRAASLVACGCLLAVALGSGLALTDRPGSEQVARIVVTGAAGALLTVAVAVVRFDWLLLGVLVSRLALDGLATGDTSLTAGAAVSGLFAVVAGPRLLVGALRSSLAPVSSLTKALYGLALCALFSAALAGNRAGALEGALEITAGALMFGALEQELQKRPKLARQVLVAVCLSAVVPVGVALVQLATGTGNLETTGIVRIHGTAVHPTPFAGYLALVAVAVLMYTNWSSLRAKLLGGGALAVLCLLILLTYTRSAWLALLLAVVYIALRTRPVILIPLIVGVIAIYSYVPGVQTRVDELRGIAHARAEDNSLAWRLEYWTRLVEAGGRASARNAITGSGLHYVHDTDDSSLQPHNIFVQAYVELGVLGLASLIGVILGYAVHVRQARRNAQDALARQAATALAAVGIVLLIQGMASNVLTQPMLYWYAAAVGLFGYRGVVAPTPTTQGARV